MFIPRKVHFRNTRRQQTADGFHLIKANIGHSTRTQPCVDEPALECERKQTKRGGVELRWDVLQFSR
jgi:hypothetical protein